MNTLRKLRNIALIILASLSVQGCLRSFLKELDDLRESIDRLALVPTYLPRFHINGIEYYRGELQFIPFVAVHGQAWEFYKETSRDRVAISACIRTINPDGTAGNTRGTLRFFVPEELVYEGSSIDTGIAELFIPSYKKTIEIESFELSFSKFQGYNPKDTVWINFSFEGGAYESYYSEETKKWELRFVEKIVCTDGVLKELVPEPR